MTRFLHILFCSLYILTGLLTAIDFTTLGLDFLGKEFLWMGALTLAGGLVLAATFLVVNIGTLLFKEKARDLYPYCACTIAALYWGMDAGPLALYLIMKPGVFGSNFTLSTYKFFYVPEIFLVMAVLSSIFFNLPRVKASFK